MYESALEAAAAKAGADRSTAETTTTTYRPAPKAAANCTVKFKNPKAPAVKREAEEDWGK
jgi:hypothetical protein